MRRKLYASLCAAVCLTALSAQAGAQGTPVNYTRALHKQLAEINSVVQRGPYKADWKSLEAYRAPDWFRDAKFGIFIHWGVYSVPAFANEWYSRNMYAKGTPAYEHEIATYGPLDKFGYKDFVPLFTAKNFDPKAWADLFVRAGARYVVPVAEHCDGFAMYDSGFTDWDAAKMGPKQDVVGELEKAVRARGLHFGVSSHRAEHWWWYNVGLSEPSDIGDPRYAGLYGPAEPMTLPADRDQTGEPDPSHLERWLPPDKAFLEDWLARSSELVDKYHPDFIYFDWWINQPAFAPYLQRMAAYYYDRSAARHQGPVLTYKEEAFPPGAAVMDVERGALDELRLRPWQSDTSVSIKSWGYVAGDQYRNAASIVTTLIDVVSKNGNLLLNVGPRSDGTIPGEVQAILLQVGAWLKVNGEAIYGTRPWVLYGEGATKTGAQEKKENVDIQYTSADIRFTAKGKTLYALGLAWPKDGHVLIKTLYRDSPYHAPIKSVALLGSDAKLVWRQTATGLSVDLPAGSGDMPYALRIE